MIKKNVSLIMLFRWCAICDDSATQFVAAVFQQWFTVHSFWSRIIKIFRAGGWSFL